MDIQYLVSESELLDHVKLFKFSLQAGDEEYKKQLQTSWITSRAVLEKKAIDVLRLRGHPDLCNKTNILLNNLKQYETIVKSHVPSETSKSADAQIFFTGEHTKSLNTVPFFILMLVFLKIWIAPVLALLTPLVLIIMPYIIMTTVMNIPIPWDTYTVMMKHMILGVQQGEPWSMKQYGQAIWTFTSMAQGMVIPFITAYHTAKLDAILVERGNALSILSTEGKKILDSFQSIGILVGDHHTIPEIPSEPHEAVAWMDSEPLGMLQLWKTLGRLCILTRIASDISWSPVIWSKLDSLNLTKLCDLAIPESRAVESMVSLKGHSLLTGPNRGGKSSCLRAILQQVLLGQTFGFTKGAVGSWKPFSLVFTRLKSRDSSGKESLFEMEVRMASNILHTTKTKKRNTLVLIDELFHSTNPPDAETSAKLFLKNLWEIPYCKSIISTHIFSLCKSVSSEIQTLCCPASIAPTGKILYSYKLQPGICKVSSVREVLEEAGLYSNALKNNTKKNIDQQ